MGCMSISNVREVAGVNLPTSDKDKWRRPLFPLEFLIDKGRNDWESPRRVVYLRRGSDIRVIDLVMAGERNLIKTTRFGVFIGLAFASLPG